MRRSIAVVGVLALFGCGGGGSSSPTAASGPPAAVATPPPSGWPVGTKVELVDGETGAPVDGTVIVAGNSMPAGSALASAAAVGATVDVAVPGYLPRQTLVRTGEARL